VVNPHLAALGVHTGRNMAVGHIPCVVLWSDFGEKDRERIEGDPARLVRLEGSTAT
jgi:hypothetical protein